MVMVLGWLGRAFGRLGSARGQDGTPPEAGEGAPTMDMSDEANSQLLAVLDDF
jgi:hypothetical protein